MAGIVGIPLALLGAAFAVIALIGCLWKDEKGASIPTIGAILCIAALAWVKWVQMPMWKSMPPPMFGE